MYTSERTVTLDNGNTVHVRRYNPYGHWRISYDKGQLPDNLARGSFTDMDLAMDALSRYLVGKKRTITSIEKTL